MSSASKFVSSTEFKWMVMEPVQGNCWGLGVDLHIPPVPAILEGSLPHAEWAEFTAAIKSRAGTFQNVRCLGILMISVVAALIGGVFFALTSSMDFGPKNSPPAMATFLGFIAWVLLWAAYVVCFVLCKNIKIDDEISQVCQQFSGRWDSRGIAVTYQAINTSLCKTKGALMSRTIHIKRAPSTIPAGAVPSQHMMAATPMLAAGLPP